MTFNIWKFCVVETRPLGEVTEVNFERRFRSRWKRRRKAVKIITRHLETDFLPGLMLAPLGYLVPSKRPRKTLYMQAYHCIPSKKAEDDKLCLLFLKKSGFREPSILGYFPCPL